MELKPQTLQALAKLIHQWSGLVIGDDKAYLVRHRLEPLVKSGKLDGFDDLLHRLKMKSQSKLCNAVVDAITTQETSFFRDAWFFDSLMQHVLPELTLLLKPAGGTRNRIRIWSAGASTGQEAYTLAMLVRELIDASSGKLRDHHFSILASDISGAALDSAEKGFYTKANVGRGVSEMRLNRHFVHRGNGWAANDSLRRLMEFRPFNLMHSPVDLGVFDLVLCRNVLIYFDEPTRERVSRGLNQVLQSGGWLGLGSAESLHASGGLHAVKLGRAVLYRKGPSAT